MSTFPGRLAARTALTLSLIASLSACGRGDDKPAIAPVTSPGAAAAGAASASAPAAPTGLAQAALEQANQQVPLSQYVDIDSGNQLMYSYLALTGLPVDYEAVAQRISSEFSGSSDAFRRKAVLDALKPRIDADVAAAGAHRYLRYQVNGQGALESYSIERGAFPGKFAQQGSYYYMNDNSDYKIGFVNGQRYHWLKVAPDAARKIEAARSSYKHFSVVLYAYAQRADTAQRQIKAQIVHVGILLNGEEFPAEPAVQE